MEHLLHTRSLITLCILGLSAFNLQAQCDADFTVSISGLTATFTDNSTYIGVRPSNSWVFGDGNWDQDKPSISHTYGQSGTYRVRLYIRDSMCGDSMFKNITIQDTTNCKALFTISQDSSNPFLMYVVNQASGNNLSYNWSFGDGSTSSNMNPTHAYNSFGTFVLCLTVTDSPFCTDTYCDTFSLDSLGNFSTKKGGFTLMVVNEIPVSVDQHISKAEVKVFPNPFKNTVTISSNLPITSTEILDVAGKVQFSSTKMQNPNVDLTQLPPGSYFVRTTIQGQVHTNKLVKH